MSDAVQGSGNNRGVVAKPTEVFEFIQHVVSCNINSVLSGRPENRAVPCVWGPAGIAKTSMFRQMEKTGIEFQGKVYYPKVIHVALAQIEEAGDLMGLPDSGEGILNDHGERVTRYDMPQWWPSEQDALDENGDPRPVILLIDDFNRADPRILKAIMQLLQDYGTNVHKLPDWTTIGLTGNPPTSDDGGTEYMVNEIDKAILTRMIHVSMKFDKTDWGVWAESSDVDKRIINFVLRYPELFDGTTGERTNPRSAVQFANLIKPIPNLQDNPRLLALLSRSCLDEIVATRFEKFIVGDMQKIVEPDEIVNNWATAEKKLDKLKTGNKLREDIMGIIVQRLYAYMMMPGLKLNDKQMDNFLAFLNRNDLIVEDAMYMLLRMLRRDGSAEQQQLFVALVQRGGKKLVDLIKKVI